MPFINLGDVNSLIQFILSVYLIGILIVVTFIDIEFRIIPDELTNSGIVLALLVSIFFPFIHKPIIQQLPDFLNGLINSLIGMVAGGGIIYLVGLIGKLVFRKEAMGFGDVKLMAFLGGFLGWESTLYTFFIACFIGSIVGILLYFITKDHYVAFGPYIAVAALIIWFYKPYVIGIIQQYNEFTRCLLIS
ncbi:MAG: A24 family peptidase [Planctomycetota bacterium]